FAPTLLEQTERLREDAWRLFTAGLARPDAAPECAAYMEVVALIGASNTTTLLNKFFDRRAEWWTYRDASSESPLDRAIQPMQDALARLGFSERTLPAAGVRAPAVVAAVREFVRVLARAPKTGKDVAKSVEKAQAWLESPPGDGRRELLALRE